MPTINLKHSNTLLITGIAIAILFYPVVGGLLYWGRPYSVANIFTSRLLIWLEVLLLYFYARKVERNNLLLWSEVDYGFWFYPASVLVLYLLAIANGVISSIPRFFGWHDNYKVVNSMMGLITKNTALMIFGGITAGVTEELIFRAYLVPRLTLLFKNRYLPVIISSLMFAAIHYRYYNLKEVIFAFLIGVIFAIHYQMYRNIKVLMLTHAIIDLIAFLIFRTAQAHHIPIKY